MLLAASLLCTGTAPFLASKAVFAAKEASAITMAQTGYTLVVGKRIQLQADIDDRFASKNSFIKAAKKRSYRSTSPAISGQKRRDGCHYRIDPGNRRKSIV